MTNRRDFLKHVSGGLVVILAAPRLSSLATLGAQPALPELDQEDAAADDREAALA